MWGSLASSVTKLANYPTKCAIVALKLRLGSMKPSSRQGDRGNAIHAKRLPAPGGTRGAFPAYLKGAQQPIAGVVVAIHMGLHDALRVAIVNEKQESLMNCLADDGLEVVRHRHPNAGATCVRIDSIRCTL